MKLSKLLLFFITLFLVCRVAAQDVVLAGWNDFDEGYKLYRWSGSAKSSVGDLSTVSGIMYGGNGSRNAWGSNDGTYGSSVPVGNSSVNGAMSLRVDSNKLNFKITNNSKRNIKLSRIAFDFASVNGNSPQNLRLYYQSGALDDANGALLQSWSSIFNGLGTVSNYQDVDVDLNGLLTDRVLGPNESALFRFVVDTAVLNNQAMAIDNVAILGSYSDLGVVTYNIHGGEGPNGQGGVTSNLTAFRDNYLQGEDVICLQEVDFDNGKWNTIKGILSDYPYTYQTINETTGWIWPWQSQQKTSIAILSKHAFTSTHSKLVQIDPQGDEWERHAQHVTINIDGKTVNIFHFHNTYNFNNNDFQYEKLGLEKFRDYVYSRLNITSLSQGGNLILLGDFNVFQANVTSILPATTRLSNGRDHIVSPLAKEHNGVYATVTATLSDHNAVWGTFDIESAATSMDTSSAIIDFDSSFPSNSQEVSDFSNQIVNVESDFDSLDEYSLNEWDEYLVGASKEDSSAQLNPWLITSSGEVTIYWDAVVGEIYQIYSSSDPDEGWELLADDLEVLNSTGAYTDTRVNEVYQFYKVELKP